MKVRVLLLGALLLLSSAALAADLTGTWQLTITGTDSSGAARSDSGTATLKQIGNQVTGTLGPDEQRQMPITEGTIKDNKVSMKVVQGPDRTMLFDLTIIGEKLVGTVERTGRPEKGAVELVRRSSK
jgi:hypothetical protein